MRVARGAKVRCELRAKMEVNAIFVKCLSGDTPITSKLSPGRYRRGCGGCHTAHGKRFFGNLVFYLYALICPKKVSVV